ARATRPAAVAGPADCPAVAGRTLARDCAWPRGACMSMSLQALANRAKVRIALGTGVVGAGLAVALAAGAMRVVGNGGALLVLLSVAAACVAHAWPRVRRHDARWAAAELDASRPGLEDSTALLLMDSSRLGPVQRLQQQRIGQRLRDMPVADLRPR